MKKVDDMLLTLAPGRARLETLRNQRRSAAVSSEVSSTVTDPSVAAPETFGDMLDMLQRRQEILLCWQEESLRLRDEMISDIRECQRFEIVSNAVHTRNDEQAHLELGLASLRRDNDILRSVNAELRTQMEQMDGKFHVMQIAVTEKQLAQTASTSELERASSVIAQLEEEKRQLTSSVVRAELIESELTRAMQRQMLASQDREQQLIMSLKDAETAAINKLLNEATAMREHYREKVKRLEHRRLTDDEKIKALTKIIAQGFPEGWEEP